MRKNTEWILILLFAIIAQNALANGPSTLESQKKFPSACRMFILKHFPETEIAHIELENGFFQSKCYHVILTNGIDIHFRQSNGKWIQIKGKPGTIPEKIFPDHLIKYLEDFYPATRIVIATKEENRYRIKLNDETELAFDCYGNPVKDNF